jgi:hypothetical protein
MRSARATASIDAPLSRAWELLLDMSRYPEWNPFIFKVDEISGPLAVGTDFKLHVRWQDGSGVATSREQVTVLEPPAAGADGRIRAVFSYRYIDLLARMGLLRAERTHILTQSPGGPVFYETQDDFAGLMSPFIPVARVQQGFEAQTQAMRATLENEARSKAVS